MDRLEELTARWLDGSLAVADGTELDALLAADPTAQARHLALLRLEAALRGLGPAPNVAAATLDRVQRESSTDLERSVMQTIGMLPAPGWSQAAVVPASDNPSRRSTLFAVAASLLVFASLGGWWLRKATVPRDTIAAVGNGQWSCLATWEAS